MHFPPLSIPYSVKGADAGNGIRIFLPDIGMFIASLTVWLVCRNIVQKPMQDNAGQYNAQFESEDVVCRQSYFLKFSDFYSLEPCSMQNVFVVTLMVVCHKLS